MNVLDLCGLDINFLDLYGADFHIPRLYQEPKIIDQLYIVNSPIQITMIKYKINK